MKVYVLSKGEYSDWSIVGIMTDRVRAENLTKIFDLNDIEEWETDEIECDPPFDKKRYFVEVNENTEVIAILQVRFPLAGDLIGNEQRRDGVYPGKVDQGEYEGHISNASNSRGNVEFQLWARDENHAKKIVFDEIARLKSIEDAGTDYENGSWSKFIKEAKEQKSWCDKVNALYVNALYGNDEESTSSEDESEENKE